MTVRSLVATLLFIGIVVVSAYDNCMILHQGYDIRFEWTLNATAIDVQISAKVTTGWFGVGFFPAASNFNHPDTVNPLFDWWLVSNTYNTGALDMRMQTSDVTQDATQNLAGKTYRAAGGYMYSTFSRLLNTGDATNDMIFDPATPMQIVYACNTAQPAGTPVATTPQHQDDCFSRTTVTLNKTPKYTCGGGDAATSGTYTSINGDFTLAYQLNAAGDGVDFSMSSPASAGWVGMGISNSQIGHDKLDTYAGWIEGGTAKVVDGYTTSKVTPTLDATQDGTGVTGAATGGTLTISFSRKLTTGDASDIDIVDGTQYLQWGLSATAGTGNTYPQHTSTGIAALNFVAGGSSALAFNFTIADYYSFTIAGLVLILAAFKWMYKILKFCNDKRRGEIKGSDVEMSHSPAMSTPGPDDEAYGNPTNGAFRRGTMYMQGGRMVPNKQTQGAGAWSDDLDAPLPSAKYAHKPMNAAFRATKLVGADYGQKSSGGRLSNWWNSMKSLRVPRTQVAVLDVALWVGWLAINIVWLFGDRFMGLAQSWNFADSFGYLSVANGFFVILPATRNSLLTWLLGVHFDSTILHHRMLGRFVIFLTVIHFFAYWIDWIPNGFWSSMTTGDTGRRNIWGAVAGIAGLWILATSIGTLRRKYFDFFFWNHFAFVAFYVFMAVHSPKSGLWYAVAAAIAYGLDRAIRMFWGLWPRRAVSVKVKAGGILQVVFPKHPLARYNVGNYVFLNFPQLSLLEWHPYTLSSGPHDDYCEVHIKSLGDHTQELYEFAKGMRSLWVRVDGPYGRFSLNHNRYPTVVLVGGGVGITPQIAALKHIYRVNMSSEMKKKKKRSPHIKNVIFVWVCPSEEVYGWFSDVLEKCKARAGKDNFPNLYPLVYITRAEKTSNPDLIAGRPQMDQVFDLTEKWTDSKRTAVVACGPSQLVNSVWDECVGRTTNDARFDFHHEIFDF